MSNLLSACKPIWAFIVLDWNYFEHFFLDPIHFDLSFLDFKAVLWGSEDFVQTRFCWQCLPGGTELLNIINNMVIVDLFVIKTVADC